MFSTFFVEGIDERIAVLHTGHMTTTWTTKGTTSDVTICGQCGREDLRGTVRLVAVDSNGEEQGEMFAGSDCASKLVGRSAARIRTEVKRADFDAVEAVREAEFRARFDAEQAWLDANGLERNFRNTKAARAALAA
jgi:hypothetical protein